MLSIHEKKEAPMDQPWLKNYPAGVPATIKYDQYASIVQLLEESY